MALWARASILLRDNAANICKVVVLIASAAIDPGGGIVQQIAAALQALTNAISPRQETGTQNGEGTVAAEAGAYGVVEDRADLTFVSDDGSTSVIGIPAPLPTVFISGTDTVDSANGDVAALIAFIQGNAKSRFNQGLTFVKGIRTRKKQMKK